MRVYIDSRPLLEENPGGIGLYTQRIMQALIEVNPDVDFVTFLNRKHSQSDKAMPGMGRLKIQSTRIPPKILHGMFWLFRRPSLERIVGLCDCYFFPNIIFTPRLTRPYVLTVHDLSYIRIPEVYAPTARLWHRAVRSRELIQNAKRIITVSEATAVDVKKQFPEKADVVRTVQSAVWRPERQERKEPSHFLVIGLIEERKNIYGVLKACEIIRRKRVDFPKILFIGKRGYLKKVTKRLFEKQKSLGWIEERGYVTEQEKLEVLARSYALIFASYYEGFGFPGLEAIVSGVPVIASRSTSLPELYQQAGVYIDPYNQREIASAIEYMFDKRPTAQSTPSILRRTWVDVAQETMHVIKEAYDDRN